MGEIVRFVAFLRGINVGGKNPISMEELKKIFVSLGFSDITTVLASGNVVFCSKETMQDVLTKIIKTAFQTAYDREICVIIRSLAEIQNLVKKNPFKHITVTPKTRLYVTFLSKKPTRLSPIPSETLGEEFQVISGVSDSEVFSVLTLSSGRNTTDLMNILEKTYGKNVTTRNWNTIQKLGKL